MRPDQQTTNQWEVLSEGEKFLAAYDALFAIDLEVADPEFSAENQSKFRVYPRPGAGRLSAILEKEAKVEALRHANRMLPAGDIKSRASVLAKLSLDEYQAALEKFRQERTASLVTDAKPTE